MIFVDRGRHYHNKMAIVRMLRLIIAAMCPHYSKPHGIVRGRASPGRAGSDFVPRPMVLEC
jgi:hypothetical protein